MSSQDMQFADPEWRPPEEREENPASQAQKPPRPINADRLDQPQWHTSSTPPQEGYFGPGYAGSQPQTPWAAPSRPIPRRRSSPWRWIILAFIILALMSGAFSRSFSGYGGPGPEPAPGGQTQSFTFKGAPNIVINGGAGAINVHTGGSGNSVIIQETTDGGPFGKSGNGIVKPTPNGNTISVNVDQGSDTTFDITVPSNENLTLTTTNGSIEVSGVSGQMTLQSTNGDITASNDVLTGPSSLISNGGNVTFSGSISSGKYQFQSNNGPGSVDVTLPSNSNFHLDATTNSGSITNNFSNVPVTGSQTHVDVGSSSAAKQTTLILTSDSGAINLSQSS